MTLFSHDTMTYLPPANFLSWLGIPFARTQSLTWEEQYEAGVRMFDIRIRFDRLGKPYFCHGAYKCKLPKGTTVNEVLFRMAEKGDIHIELISEERWQDFNDWQETNFVKWAKAICPALSQLCHVGGGRHERTQTQLIDCGQWNVHPAPYDGSKFEWATSSKIKPIPTIPWVYARFFNKKNMEKAKEKGVTYILLDFVQYQ